jgi:hypothetical protein
MGQHIAHRQFMPGLRPRVEWAGVEVNAICAICESPLVAGAGYIVRMDVFADPEMAGSTSVEIEAGDLNAAIAAVIEEAKNLSDDDLQDGVHRHFEFRLCPRCHRRFLANPLGMPRKASIGKN